MKQKITWNSIEIVIDFNPNYSKAFKDIYGHQLAHVQIYANQPLPITETGYRSHFISASEIEQCGGVVAFVVDALDQAAKSPSWKRFHADQAQLSLF